MIVVDLLILAGVLSIILMQLRPIVLKLAQAQVNSEVLKIVNNVIETEISKGTFDYSTLVKLEKDSSGNIAALEMNMPIVNLLQSRISKSVLESIQNQMVSEMHIPIGNAVGGVLFSGRGPAIDVRILSAQNIKTQFISETIPAGINQTRHKITLEVSVDISVFAPGTKAVTTTTTTDVEVSDTVIVGKVPNVYANIGDNP
ncbi:sporulation protein YunB [Sporobacter termitidis]|nr:sporulation protein YunB [Sporobacter termitidis]